MKKDLIELNKNIEFKDIESMSAERYSKLCKEKVQAKAFDFLQKKKVMKMCAKYHIQG